MSNYQNKLTVCSILACVCIFNISIAQAVAKSNSKIIKSLPTHLTVSFGHPTYKHILKYRKMYSKKPFPDAVIYYYDNGVYKIISEGEDHYGVYSLSGDFTNETYSIRYISLPSPDWGNKTAFHQLTFIHNDNNKGVFIQDAVVDTGHAIAQQNGTYSLKRNEVINPLNSHWK
ncbi:hypothetical protein [Cysteiniphilum marinum]|uniref:hypothetical protein n=1 Tax=Cysteiniphilum marinum TaxID=2774191 RepID=UPI00193C1732|nr:hypothetical protein [Cysteiniphilum marinum]